MKTPEEILEYELSGMSVRMPKVLLPMIKRAMNEYAKQWIDKAATVGRMYAGLNSANAIEDLKSKIDAQ